jgi:glycosyltransferase involved in cell wall biosynthesis
MIRTALIATDPGWMGGVSYFRNLIQALQSQPDRRIEPLLYVAGSGAAAYQGVDPGMIVPTRSLERRTAQWFARKVGLRLLARDLVLEPRLRKQKISAAFLAGYFGPAATTPAIGWIADFQHRHVPELFSAQNRRVRDLEFARVCRHCARIVVSSHSAYGDLQSFSPEHAHKGRVLQFVSNMDLELCRDIRTADLEQTYGFSGRYFLLPNQFWVHKNHRIVIEALHVLRRSAKPVTVLATGSTDDYRQPGHLDSLLALLRDYGLQECFRILGVVPYVHLLGLMRDAVAVLNPSLFEGWSTSVEEAKSVGKQVVLSDIPVHREQMPADGRFFPPRDADALARHLLDLDQAFEPAIDAERMAQARRNLPARQRAFALTFQDIVLECALDAG